MKVFKQCQSWKRKFALWLDSVDSILADPELIKLCPDVSSDRAALLLSCLLIPLREETLRSSKSKVVSLGSHIILESIKV